MKTIYPLEAQNLLMLIKLFAQANPIYAIGQIQNNQNLTTSLKEFLFPASARSSCKFFGDFERIKKACEKLSIKHLIQHEPVVHVIPIVQELMNEGFMVPLKMTPSDDWEISDAFGTFGKPSEKTIRQIFEDFLKGIETKWVEANPGKVLPLRWRKSFALSLQGYLSFDAIGGESLQVPLIIAVLRSFAQQPVTSSGGGNLPFGNNPVFSSGIVDFSTGIFEPVEGLDIKLRAFVREYGEGLPAILTRNQIQKIKANIPDLIDQVNVIEANNLTELMALKELYDGLIILCSPPQPTEIDDLLELMFKMRRSIRFGDMKKIIDWLRPNIQGPVYAFQLERNLGQIEAHRARFPKAQYYLKNAAEIMSQNEEWFGISERIDLATAWGTLAVDACDSRLAKSFLGDAEKHLGQAKVSERAKFWGTLCQIYRMTGEYDNSILAGRKSVLLADMALAGEAGRDRNYLIHALIARARSKPDTRDLDLADASNLLVEAQNQWAPMNGREAHFGYCQHFEAEIARLQGKAFHALEKPIWSGHWGHPWMFVLLSCTRNRKNDWQSRMRYAHKMVDFSGELASNSKESLFVLFHNILLMYFHDMNGQPIAEQLDQIVSWCETIQEKGFPGWYNRLMPFVIQIRGMSDPTECIDEMCDDFFYF